MSHIARKLVVDVSDQVRHTPDCITTEGGSKFRIQKVEGFTIYVANLRKTLVTAQLIFAFSFADEKRRFLLMRLIEGTQGGARKMRIKDNS